MEKLSFSFPKEKKIVFSAQTNGLNNNWQKVFAAYSSLQDWNNNGYKLWWIQVKIFLLEKMKQKWKSWKRTLSMRWNQDIQAKCKMEFLIKSAFCANIVFASCMAWHAVILLYNILHTIHTKATFTHQTWATTTKNVSQKTNIYHLGLREPAKDRMIVDILNKSLEGIINLLFAIFPSRAERWACLISD